MPIFPPNHRNSVINVSGYYPFQLLTIALHTSGVPDLLKISLQVLFLVKVTVNQNLLLLIWFYANSHHDVVVRIHLSFFWVGSEDDGMTLEDVFFHPFEVRCVLGLLLASVPFIVIKTQFIESLYSVFADEEFRACCLPHFERAAVVPKVQSNWLDGCLTAVTTMVIPLETWSDVYDVLFDSWISFIIITHWKNVFVLYL